MANLTYTQITNGANQLNIYCTDDSQWHGYLHSTVTNISVSGNNVIITAGSDTLTADYTTVTQPVCTSAANLQSILNGYIGKGGSGALAIGEAIGSADANVVLFSDANSELGQDANFTYENSILNTPKIQVNSTKIVTGLLYAEIPIPPTTITVGGTLLVSQPLAGALEGDIIQSGMPNAVIGTATNTSWNVYVNVPDSVSILFVNSGVLPSAIGAGAVKVLITQVQ